MIKSLMISISLASKIDKILKKNKIDKNQTNFLKEARKKFPL